MMSGGEGMRIFEASSINLRASRVRTPRILVDPIRFTCSICKKSRALGKNTFAMSRMVCDIDGVDVEITMCEKCIDILVDLIRYGPRVINEIGVWQRLSRVMRVSLVQDDLVCVNCLRKDVAHLVFKYDDLTAVKAVYLQKRICSVCVDDFLKLMMGCERLADCKLSEGNGQKIGVFTSSKSPLSVGFDIGKVIY